MPRRAKGRPQRGKRNAMQRIRRTPMGYNQVGTIWFNLPLTNFRSAHQSRVTVAHWSNRKMEPARIGGMVGARVPAPATVAQNGDTDSRLHKLGQQIKTGPHHNWGAWRGLRGKGWQRIAHKLDRDLRSVAVARGRLSRSADCKECVCSRIDPVASEGAAAIITWFQVRGADRFQRGE